jgi:hypothetical protein
MMLFTKISTRLGIFYPPKSIHDGEIERKIRLDRVNYARISSYCSLFVTGISTGIGFFGVILVLKGQITIGVLTLIGRFLANNGFEKIAADANRRVDRMSEND